MSAVSAHRLKDRGGAKIAAQKPTKTLTPISISDKNPNQIFKKSASGKENPKSISGVPVTAQKPTIRPVPRVEKAITGSGTDSEGRVRWSNSSAPRGRSQSPSEFIRLFSDLKKDRVSRVSVDKRDKSVGRGRGLESGSGEKKVAGDSNVKGTEGVVDKLRAFRNCKESGVLRDDFGNKRGISEELGPKVKENGDLFSGIRNSGENCNRGVNSSSNGVKISGVSASGGIEFLNVKDGLNLHSKVQDGVGTKKVVGGKSSFDLKSDTAEENRKFADLYLKESGEKSMNNVNVPGTSKERGKSEEGIGSRVGNKYPSKLHEKLAFLEGKVKRIASDIKRTKEMLDLNNPDASKVILSDIQDKISGIEKAMGRVGDSDSEMSTSKSSGNSDQGNKMDDQSQSKLVNNVKNGVNNLNVEELEARLFPHHKLLRSRSSVKASSGSSSHEPSSESKLEEKSLSPIEENPIALEFLASLKTENINITARGVHTASESCEVQEMDAVASSGGHNSSQMLNEKVGAELILTTDETLDDFDDQENREALPIGDEIEDICINQLNEIGSRTSTGGWFVSEGESVLLAHDDGSCSFYDIANCEDKAVYKPPEGVSPNMWRDCWIIRAPGADGCSGRYVVAASAGTTVDSGFCSWDFYTKDIRASHIESGGTNTARTILGPIPNNTLPRRNVLSDIVVPETHQWWYKPCGPLIISTGSAQRIVTIHDIRDGEQIMKWEVQKQVLTMDYLSPLQWRNRGKVVVAELDAVSLWDVNSLNPQALLSVSSSGRKISALHVNNTDAELGSGVRQRVSSSEAEGNDGFFCTADSINILDFRQPSGIGLKIPKPGVNVQSVFSRGDSIFLGCASVRSGRKQPYSQVQQFSLRKGRLLTTYSLPESDFHLHCSAITQVWGDSDLIMGVCGQGLFVFDALKDDGWQSFTGDHGSAQKVREIIGPNDLYAPSFDYLASRVLLISRDRPALWRHLSYR